MRLLKKCLENKLGESVLQESLDNWDERDEYDQKPGRQVDGMKLAFMVLKRNDRKAQKYENANQMTASCKP